MPRIATLNRLLRRARVNLVPDGRMGSLARERHLSRLLKAYDVTCVLDVGAYRGEFRDLISGRIGWEGPVVSFEPVRRSFNVISARSAGNPAWRVRNYALGSEEGVREISPLDPPGLASLRALDLGAMRRLMPRHAVRVIAHELTRVRRLSDVFDEVTAGLDARRVLLKVDARGYELEVFRGAAAVLPRVCLLELDLSLREGYEDMQDFAEAWHEVCAGGFDVSGMYPVAMDHAHRATEIDCTFVSRSKAREAGLLPRANPVAAQPALRSGPGKRRAGAS